MRKILTYIGFIIACLLVSLLFVTATTYIQLAIAVILYPVVAYFAMKILPRRARKVSVVVTQLPLKPSQTTVQAEGTVREEVVDFDKRTFLKFVGATGIFFFVSSLLGKRADGLLGKALNSGGDPPTSMASGASGQTSDSLVANGYIISEIDDNVISYYGFTNKDSAWYIMKEDTNTGSFRYCRGDSDFPGNWANRERLTYDYFNRVF